MKNLNIICNRSLLLMFVFISTCIFMGCEKLVNVDDPVTGINTKLVFSTDADAAAVITDIYIKMSLGEVSSVENITSMPLFTGLSADELALFPGNNNPGFVAHFQNKLTSTLNGAANYWGNLYSMIFVTNAAVEGLSTSTTLSPAVKQQLLGEAKFLRAYFYFNLVNTYGDVPLNLTTDYAENAKRPRTDKNVVYQQIVQDLKDAKGLLSKDYKTATLETSDERVKPNQYAADALLARVYLYTGNYTGAEAEATTIISNNSVYDLVGVDEVFLKNKKETIWSLLPIDANRTNTSDAIFFLPNLNFGEPLKVILQSSFVNTFDLFDKRRINWIGKYDFNTQQLYYAAKYKNNEPAGNSTEYPIVMRIAEQYLIRAEARARQGILTGANSAESDLNVIRDRAGLGVTTATGSQEEMIDAILEERRKELFTEWGHRWFDLKRTGKATAVLQPLKGANWQETDQLYPIPQDEIDRNPGIRGHQNAGY